MKKNSLILTLKIMILFGLCACSDNNGTDDSNQIRLYGEPFLLEQGAIYHDNNHSVIAVNDYIFEDRYQINNEEQVDMVTGFTAEVKEEQTGNFLIGLYEKGFVVSDLTKDARGNGACICLRFASPEQDKLTPGKYTYSLNRDEYTFKGYSSVNYDTEESSVPNELTQGEVNISREGDIYTIMFKCTTSFGGIVEGQYSGILKFIDIRKEYETVKQYKGIKLEALFDEINYTDMDGAAHREPDYLRATSFLSSSTQQIYSANLYKDLAESAKKSIDIALAYDKANEILYFESPIKARALLWHNTFQNENLFGYSFDLPCHTQYMPAPENFTNEDFENLSRQEDFAFPFSEAKTSIPVTADVPCFIFVQTGNGLKGVIRINDITPESTEMIGGITYPVNPAVNIDIKFPHSFSEQKMR